MAVPYAGCVRGEARFSWQSKTLVVGGRGRGSHGSPIRLLWGGRGDGSHGSPRHWLWMGEVAVLMAVPDADCGGKGEAAGSDGSPRRWS